MQKVRPHLGFSELGRPCATPGPSAAHPAWAGLLWLGNAAWSLGPQPPPLGLGRSRPWAAATCAPVGRQPGWLGHMCLHLLVAQRAPRGPKPAHVPISLKWLKLVKFIINQIKVIK